jgi:hypothetical protein
MSCIFNLILQIVGYLVDCRGRWGTLQQGHIATAPVVYFREVELHSASSENVTDLLKTRVETLSLLRPLFCDFFRFNE